MWKGFGFRRLLTVSLSRRSGSRLCSTELLARTCLVRNFAVSTYLLSSCYWLSLHQITIIDLWNLWCVASSFFFCATVCGHSSALYNIVDIHNVVDFYYMPCISCISCHFGRWLPGWYKQWPTATCVNSFSSLVKADWEDRVFVCADDQC